MVTRIAKPKASSSTAKVAKKKPAAKKVVAKKVIAKKPAAKKVAAKKVAAKKPAATLPTTKPATKTATGKPIPKKTFAANNKTQATRGSVEEFFQTITDAAKQADTRTVSALMEKVTGEAPKMWGSAIVGFGSRRLVYDSGREQDWLVIGFSPRKQNLTIYLNDGFERYTEQLAQLGKHSIGKSCLYLNKLSEVNMKVLEQMVRQSVATIRAKSD